MLIPHTYLTVACFAFGIALTWFCLRKISFPDKLKKWAAGYLILFFGILLPYTALIVLLPEVIVLRQTQTYRNEERKFGLFSYRGVWLKPLATYLDNRTPERLTLRRVRYTIGERISEDATEYYLDMADDYDAQTQYIAPGAVAELSHYPQSWFYVPYSVSVSAEEQSPKVFRWVIDKAGMEE